MKTKIELERQIKELKEEIRVLRKNTKLALGSLDSLPFSGIGVAIDDKDNYNIVKIKFNLSGNAQVGETLRINRHRDKTAIHARNAIVDEVIALGKIKNKRRD